MAITSVWLKKIRAERWYLLFAAAAILITLSPLLAGRFYGTGDMRDVFIPLETFFHQGETHAFLPAWQPNAAWGFPVIAAAQIGFFYPPLLLLRWLPLWVYLPAIFIAHSLVLVWGMYLFLRVQRSSPWAALLGALALSLSAFVFEHTTHINIALALAWLPWQLLAAHAAATNRRWLSALGWVVAAGIPFLIGQI